jgi:hypothetical protein
VGASSERGLSRLPSRLERRVTNEREEDMSESRHPQAGANSGDTFSIGDVAAGARVAQGKYITWVESSLEATPEGQDLKQQFEALLERIDNSEDLDSDTRNLVAQKTTAVANGLANAQKDPSRLRMALLESKAVLGSLAGWTWTALSEILKSDAAQKTIGTISEAGTRAAIGAIVGK